MLAGLVLPPAVAAASASPLVSPEGAALYARALVLDANALASVGALLHDDQQPLHLRQIRESGISAIKTTLGGAAGSFEETVADIARAQQLVESHPGLFLKVVTADDLARAKREGKVALIFSFEAASMLEDRLERIDLFRGLGVRVMQLTYNHATPFGGGCLDDASIGLSPLGREAIARMNALGVALDLSHSNARTTGEGIAASRMPPLVTHAGCSAVFDHPRNKRDAELRAMADKGGVVGIYMLPFLTEDGRQPLLADYIAHLEHALRVCGEDHVGIGTDALFFPVGAEDIREMDRQMRERQLAGTGAPGENRTPYLPDANTPRRLALVTDALLRRGHAPRVVEKVLGANFARAFGDIWGSG
jgi:membrane dipeptidase